MAEEFAFNPSFSVHVSVASNRIPPSHLYQWSLVQGSHTKDSNRIRMVRIHHTAIVLDVNNISRGAKASFRYSVGLYTRSTWVNVCIDGEGYSSSISGS